MEPYILSCESTADLTREHLKSRNIHYICYPYELDGKSYRDDLGVTIPFEDFYAAMSRGAMTKTAQINAYESTPMNLKRILNRSSKKARIYSTYAFLLGSPALSIPHRLHGLL